VNFLLAGPGQVAAGSGFDDLLEDGAIDEGAFYVAAGHVHEGVVNSLGRVGYFLANAPTRAELMARSRDAYDSLSLLDDSGSEMLFWPEAELTNG
jgi:hypothetical protein